MPFQPQWSRPVFHLFVVRVNDRAALQKHLADAKIDTPESHYPVPLHQQKAYAHLGVQGGRLSGHPKESRRKSFRFPCSRS